MFSDPETYEAIPLVIKSHMPFVVTYTGDRNDHHVRSLISKLLSAERYTSQISPTTYHTLYYPRDMDPWIQPRLTTVGWFHEGIMPSVRWYSVKATTTDWFGELRRVLGELGVVIPSEEVLEPALEATRDYFRFA
ncbi:MAG: hypothetical protein A3C53_04725 [Omnitrophica WOR_2 bacterium RIFCSPHIGHO2_02_FULL_68_15]|nr:MAG: hypothetical protein A3C53_04725 [Omnitrophica WOR_2 bacterium RIFCSPHIGHO2_02_FULL_68_15]